MSETARIIFGVCGIAGGLSGLAAAFIVWRAGRVELADLRKRLDLPKSP
ncbi:hypothetical protein [Streptomyces tendae]|nr:hypothetical protein [Streptomyces tendae]